MACLLYVSATGVLQPFDVFFYIKYYQYSLDEITPYVVASDFSDAVAINNFIHSHFSHFNSSLFSDSMIDADHQKTFAPHYDGRAAML